MATEIYYSEEDDNIRQLQFITRNEDDTVGQVQFITRSGDDTIGQLYLLLGVEMIS